MNISSQKEGNILIFHIEGRVDQNTQHAAMDWIEEKMKQGEKWFLGDFSKLEYINSSGIGFLLRATKELVGTNGGLVIYNLKSEIRQLFELTGLSSVINITDTKEKALAMVKG